MQKEPKRKMITVDDIRGDVMPMSVNPGPPGPPGPPGRSLGEQE